MSSIRDLRETLEQHAQGVHDDELVGRTASVRDRVRTVRRRRRATAVAGTAAVLAAVVGVGILPLGSEERPPAPADRSLVGLTAPESISSLGYTYAFAAGAEGTDRVSIDLAEHTGPVVVTWATAGADDEVRVQVPGGGRHRELSKDFAGFLPATGGEGEVTVAGDGPVAVAVYTLDEHPPGITEDDITLRQDVAGARLLAGDIGELGALEVTVEAVVPESGRMAMSAACRGVPAGLVVVAEETEGLYTYGECDNDDPLVDAAHEDWTPLDLRGQGLLPGDTVTVRLYVGEDLGAPRDAPEPITEGDGLDRVRLAVGLYEEPAPMRAGQTGFDRVIEEDGHRWELVDTEVSARGAGTLSVEVPVQGDGPTLVAVAGSGLVTGEAYFLRDGETESSFRNMTESAAGFFERRREEEPGHVYTLEGRSATGPRTVLSFGFYERVD